MVWCEILLQLMMWFFISLETNLQRHYVQADFKTLHSNPTVGMFMLQPQDALQFLTLCVFAHSKCDTV